MIGLQNFSKPNIGNTQFCCRIKNILTLKFQFQISKVCKSYIDSDDDGLEIGRHGDEDEVIVIDTEHARRVDTEGGGEAVADVNEGN